MFNDPHMKAVNSILDRCVVEDPAHCLPSANELLPYVDEALARMEMPMPILDDHGDFQVPCRMCGRGNYKPGAVFSLPVLSGGATQAHALQAYACDFCTHFEFFANGYPAEIAKKSLP